MRKATGCLATLALLTGCVAENTEKTYVDTPHYKVKKISTDDGKQLDQVTIGGPDTPPQGYDRPVVKFDKNVTQREREK